MPLLRLSRDDESDVDTNNESACILNVMLGLELLFLTLAVSLKMRLLMLMLMLHSGVWL